MRKILSMAGVAVLLVLALNSSALASAVIKGKNKLWYENNGKEETAYYLNNGKVIQIQREGEGKKSKSNKVEVGVWKGKEFKSSLTKKGFSVVWDGKIFSPKNSKGTKFIWDGEKIYTDWDGEVGTGWFYDGKTFKSAEGIEEGVWHWDGSLEDGLLTFYAANLYPGYGADHEGGGEGEGN